MSAVWEILQVLCVIAVGFAIGFGLIWFIMAKIMDPR